MCNATVAQRVGHSRTRPRAAARDPKPRIWSNVPYELRLIKNRPVQTALAYRRRANVREPRKVGTSHGSNSELIYGFRTVIETCKYRKSPIYRNHPLCPKVPRKPDPMCVACKTNVHAESLNESSALYLGRPKPFSAL